MINLTIHAQSYTQIIDLYDSKAELGKNGAYYKDTQGYLNQYVGTWLYTNSTTNLKITFQKEYFAQQNAFGTYYSDVLVGEYEYKVNRVTVFSTLNNLNILNTKTYKSNQTNQNYVDLNKKNIDKPLLKDHQNIEKR